MESRASRTATMAAVTRGRHQLLDPEPWILVDPEALDLVGPEWERYAEAADALWPAELSRQLRAGIATRSRFAEDRLLEGGATQYVLLGAGLDSVAWRRTDLLETVRIYEVDHPHSQAWKRQRVAELGWIEHPHHVYAPVDFEAESLADGLDAVGFDRTAPTLFAWLGVVPYLTPAAIDATLGVIAGCASGSEVALEYGLPERFQDDVALEFTSRFTAIAERVGEPLQVSWSPSEAEDVIARNGLVVVDHPSRADLTRRYFSDRSDGLRPWSASGLLVARVP